MKASYAVHSGPYGFAPAGRFYARTALARGAKAAGRFRSAEEAGRISKAEDLPTFKKVLQSESDRGCLLLGHAVLDDALACLLYRFLIEQCLDKSDDAEQLIRRLFTFGQLAGSFWARAQLCFALGLIEGEVLATLDDIRELRNYVAHNPTDFSFNDSRLEGLWTVFDEDLQKALAALESARKAMPPEIIKGTLLERHNRTVFEKACVLLWIRLILMSFEPEQMKKGLAELVKRKAPRSDFPASLDQSGLGDNQRED